MSSLDSMHVIMGVMNKMPISLKRAWVEYSVLVKSNLLTYQNSFLKKAESLIQFLDEKPSRLERNPDAKLLVYQLFHTHGKLTTAKLQLSFHATIAQNFTKFHCVLSFVSSVMTNAKIRQR